MNAKAHIYTARALERGRVASPTLGRLYPRYSFYRRLSGPQDQSGHEGVKKKKAPPLRHPGSNPGNPATWATWATLFVSVEPSKSLIIYIYLIINI